MEATLRSEKADEWREIRRLISTTAARRNYRTIDSEWLSEVLTGHLGALGLHDYGLFMALGGPIRDCLVDTLRAAIVTTGLDYLDNAQMIVAEKVFLGQVSPHAQADVAPPSGFGCTTAPGLGRAESSRRFGARPSIISRFSSRSMSFTNRCSDVSCAKSSSAMPRRCTAIDSLRRFWDTPRAALRRPTVGYANCSGAT